MSCSTPFCPNSFTCKCSLQQAVGLVQGLAFATPSILDPAETSRDTLLLQLWRSCAMVLQDQSLHTLQLVIDGVDVGVGLGGS